MAVDRVSGGIDSNDGAGEKRSIRGRIAEKVSGDFNEFRETIGRLFGDIGEEKAREAMIKISGLEGGMIKALNDQSDYYEDILAQQEKFFREQMRVIVEDSVERVLIKNEEKFWKKAEVRLTNFFDGKFKAVTDKIDSMGSTLGIHFKDFKDLTVKTLGQMCSRVRRRVSRKVQETRVYTHDPNLLVEVFQYAANEGLIKDFSKERFLSNFRSADGNCGKLKQQDTDFIGIKTELAGMYSALFSNGLFKGSGKSIKSVMTHNGKSLKTWRWSTYRKKKSFPKFEAKWEEIIREIKRRKKN